MTEQKFFGIQDSPGQVLQSFETVVAGTGEYRLPGGQLVWGWRSAKGGPIQVGDDLLDGSVRFGHSTETAPAIGEHFVQALVADQREGLFERGAIGALAVAGQQPLGLAKGFEEPLG